MESALYGIYALVVFVSEILLVRCAHSFDFWYVNNSCVNTVRQHFPWSILYKFASEISNCGVYWKKKNKMMFSLILPTGNGKSLIFYALLQVIDHTSYRILQTTLGAGPSVKT